MGPSSFLRCYYAVLRCYLARAKYGDSAKQLRGRDLHEIIRRSYRTISKFTLLVTLLSKSGFRLSATAKPDTDRTDVTDYTGYVSRDCGRICSFTSSVPRSTVISIGSPGATSVSSRWRSSTPAMELRPKPMMTSRSRNPAASAGERGSIEIAIAPVLAFSE